MAKTAVIDITETEGVSPESYFESVATKIREYLQASFPEEEGFSMTEKQQASSVKPDLGSISYFRPMSILKYKNDESNADNRYTFELHNGSTTGVEIKLGLNNAANPEIKVSVEWNSAIYDKLLTIAITIGVIGILIGVIGTLMDKYQNGNGMILLLYILLPWKLLWSIILMSMIVLLPAMIVVWLISKLFYLCGSRRFNSNELDEVLTRISDICAE